ncbi:hypothetical protein [Thermodesulforhabdus norvegica]|uniref:Uncharacterized protein n=1 Tax=Thermodesulforhabdus norvegica TaxID=39841 RepID=A0A1I4T880_9BACT|nr:hypothetical protein [Thermodesulforhabdus norvegica]SFM72777.1 hypothetical protein SAMN05660836_01277 [Thermodesulforhabdus norvegica]
MTHEVNTSESYILREISRAGGFYGIFGKELIKAVQPCMDRALRCVERSRRIMQELGLDEICRKCDEEEGGSCCGKGIENYYGMSLLLANLMAAVELPKKRYDPGGCFFLVPGGCSLVFRHTICVNYLCRKIYDELGSDSIVKLQEISGHEINAVFELNERILAFLRFRNHGSADL